ncbi:MAG TPA: energy transducer TonB [Caulobacterales bacterium]|nr:energy transducer TonB [Caulobacterales bacterium]
MQVAATRAISSFARTGLFLAGLFLFVIVTQIAVVAALRGLNVSGGLSLLISGGVVLAIVFGATAWMRASARATAARLESERVAAGMPEAPCCVIWRARPGEADFPWELEGDVRAAYPPLAQRLGVEGFAVVDFEVGADGAAKNLHCIDYWPSRLFYDSAAEALRAARFRLRPGAGARFGPSYRIPFVFRIRGAARVRDKGHTALGPVFYAAKQIAIATGKKIAPTRNSSPR